MQRTSKEPDNQLPTDPCSAAAKDYTRCSSSPDRSNGRTEKFGVAESLATIVEQLRRIADHFDPPPGDLVDTGYVANLLNCTKDYVAQMAREGIIPPNCLVAGTGWGKPWRFHRSRIDGWIHSR
jgi:hypothetical protein